jgi:hypothetical protein
LYEVRMSPQLHATVYGYMPHDFGQQVRFGGFRPMVFMQHGLAVAFFMAVATVLAAAIRTTDPTAGGWRRWAVWVLAATLVSCKSVGAIVLAGVGLVLLATARSGAARAGLLVVAAVPPAYCVARSTGAWDGSGLVRLSADSINDDRAQSLGFRFEQENELIVRALERPLFGWGGWGRNRVKDEQGKDVSVTDGVWIIVLGNYGLLGLVAYGAMALLPVVRHAWRELPDERAGPVPAAVTGCAIVVGLWCIDSLLNALFLPVFVVLAGALTRTTPAADHENGAAG